jgi:CheY-like chemotaxis protein
VVKRVLIVDDEPDICELFSFEFEADGFETFRAGNAKEAVEVLQTQTVDAILSDIRMPGGSGIELLSWVRQNRPLSIVFVLMTGYSDVSLETAFDLGAHGIFHKPLQLEEVTDFINRCLGNPGDTGPAKRRSGRLPIVLEASFWTDSTENKCKATVRDISRGGVRMSSAYQPPDTLALVSITFLLPHGGGTLIEGTAQIRWQTPTPDVHDEYQFGLEFQTLSQSSVESLFAFLTAKGITPLTDPAPAASS